MTKIINIVTNSADLTFGGLIVQGTTDDGRITYRSDDESPVIDGRKTWRGCWWHTQERVEANDWAAACALMTEVNAATQAECGRREAEANAKADAREASLIGIETVRGGAYDPNAY